MNNKSEITKKITLPACLLTEIEYISKFKPGIKLIINDAEFNLIIILL